MPVLCNSTLLGWVQHCMHNSWETPPCWGKQMLIRFLISTSCTNFPRVCWSCLMRWWTSYVLLGCISFYRTNLGRFSLDLSWWLYPVKTSEYTVPPVSTTFNISFLYISVNFECKVKCSSCTPEMKKKRLNHQHVKEKYNINLENGKAFTQKLVKSFYFSFLNWMNR